MYWIYKVKALYPQGMNAKAIFYVKEYLLINIMFSLLSFFPISVLYNILLKEMCVLI